MVGASGAIFGHLVAYGLIFGEGVMLFMLLFPMKAKHFVWIIAAVEFLTTLYSANGKLSSVAHLGGMVAGFFYLWGWASLQIAQKRRADPLYQRKKRVSEKARHLKLVVNKGVEPPSGPKPPGGGDDFGSGSGGPKTWH